MHIIDANNVLFIHLVKNQLYLVTLLIKEQEKSSRKTYAIDIGLSNQVGFKFSLWLLNQAE
jgi:hypothetical protein